MTAIPDLVQISKLETQFSADSKSTQHVYYVSGSTPRERRVRKEEIWTKEKALGHGNFGIVWSERCIRGDMKGKVRAVKKIQKLESCHYYRELEAIALFSHQKVSLLMIPHVKLSQASTNDALSSPSAGMMTAIAYS
jgi:calcium/calmodulin-dependent protein kinase I